MRILYYCPEYYSPKHGGKTHAREFLKALRHNPDVVTADVWPDPGEYAEPGKKARNKPPSKIKSLKRFLRYFKPQYKITAEICDMLDKGSYDCLIIRTAGYRNLESLCKSNR